MAKFTLVIETADNDTFAGDQLIPELKRQLKVTRWMIGQYLPHRRTVGATRPVFDVNGKAVGHWSYSGDDIPEGTSVEEY